VTPVISFAASVANLATIIKEWQETSHGTKTGDRILIGDPKNQSLFSVKITGFFTVI
jgi:hypothetical protein